MPYDRYSYFNRRNLADAAGRGLAGGITAPEAHVVAAGLAADAANERTLYENDMVRGSGTLTKFRPSTGGWTDAKETPKTTIHINQSDNVALPNLAGVAPASPAPAPASPAPVAPSLITHPQFEDVEGRADGGDVEARVPYLVGERGPELMVPDQPGTIIPNEQLQDLAVPRAEGGRVAAGGELVPKEAVGPLIHAHSQLAHDVAALQKATEQAKITAQGTVEAHRESAAPYMVKAQSEADKERREYLAGIYKKRDDEYRQSENSLKENWSQLRQKMEQDYQVKTGQPMSPAQIDALKNADLKFIIRANQDYGTPDYQRMAALGMPAEGEPARAGQLYAQGFSLNQDGSWQRERTNDATGAKYTERFAPTPEGLARTELPIKPERLQGPGIYQQEGKWYGPRGSSPMNNPPRILSIDQALDPRFVSSYNKAADKYGMPKVTPEMLQSHPEAAAWRVLEGVNLINTKEGWGNLNDNRYLNAPTYALSPEDNRRADEVRQAWAAGKPAPAVQAGAALAPAPVNDMIAQAAGAPAAGAAVPETLAPAQAPTAQVPATPQATPGPTSAEAGAMGTQEPMPQKPLISQEGLSEDPAVRNWQVIGRSLAALGRAAGGGVANVAGGAVDLANRGAQGLVGLATGAARQVIPGAYKVLPGATAENPMGLPRGEGEVLPETPAFSGSELVRPAETAARNLVDAAGNAGQELMAGARGAGRAVAGEPGRFAENLRNVAGFPTPAYPLPPAYEPNPAPKPVYRVISPEASMENMAGGLGGQGTVPMPTPESPGGPGKEQRLEILRRATGEARTVPAVM